MGLPFFKEATSHEGLKSFKRKSQKILKQVSRVLQEYFKELFFFEFCCVAAIAATQAKGGLVHHIVAFSFGQFRVYWKQINLKLLLQHFYNIYLITLGHSFDV